MLVKVFPQLLQGVMMTVKISILSVIIGSIGGILMGIFISQQMKIPILSPLIKSYIAVMRGTPIFIQLLILYFGISEVTGLAITPFMSGVLTFGLNSTAYIAEIIRGGINALPKGQWEASYCLGYNTFQTLLYIIIPQTFRNVFPSLTNEFISVVKDSSILMILGVHELTKVSKDIVARELMPFEIYTVTALLYFSITTLVSILATKFEGGKNGQY